VASTGAMIAHDVAAASCGLVLSLVSPSVLPTRRSDVSDTVLVLERPAVPDSRLNRSHGGKRTPHVSTWATLAELVGLEHLVTERSFVY
jgi:hypothetical protein